MFVVAAICSRERERERERESALLRVRETEKKKGTLRRGSLGTLWVVHT